MRRPPLKTSERAQLALVCMWFGRTRGPRLQGFIEAWAAETEAAGRSLGVEEFARRSGMPVRTAYRRLADFRAAFGRIAGVGYDGTPDAFLGPLLGRIASDVQAGKHPPAHGR